MIETVLPLLCVHPQHSTPFQCVDLLLSYGSDVNHIDEYPPLQPCKRTAIFYAVEGGHVECMTLLITSGASVSKLCLKQCIFSFSFAILRNMIE